MAIAALTASYAEIAADITALSIIQVQMPKDGSPAFAEVLAAASAPSAATRGIQLAAGEAATGDNITAIGASGKLYARLYFSEFPTNLYTA